VRACTPDPGPWTGFRGERLKLGPVTVTSEAGLALGRLRVEGQQVLVGTASTAVRLGSVQPPGKRPMPAADWARGARLTGEDHLAH
jgi:methionyl-tRNA formyltransferase